MPKPLQSLSWSPVIAVTRQHPESLSVSRRLLSPSHQRPAASMSLTPLLLLLLVMTMLLTSIPTTQANKGTCYRRASLHLSIYYTVAYRWQVHPMIGLIAAYTLNSDNVKQFIAKHR